MHPHKSEASESSRSKMRAITGRGGGGTSFLGMSPFKRPGPDGETTSYHSHDKAFASPKAAGGKVKRRADKFARGGKVKKARGGPTESDRPRYIDTQNVGEPGEALRYSDTHPEAERPGPMGDAGPPSVSPSELPNRKIGGRIKRADGGRTKAKKAGGGPAEDTTSEAMFGSQDPASEDRAARESATAAGQHRKDPIRDSGDKRGGRIKRADGGRTLMPYGPERRSTSRAKPGKKAGNVNIAINMPPHISHPGGGMPPPMPPGGLPGGAGGPPGMPPGGGAPPPPIPPALMGGAGGMPGGMPGGAPGGANPAAMQALAGIAGGAGPMGAGMPGRGPFAKGGSVKSTGLSSNLGHWREYSTRNTKGNSAHNRGATGESEELPLRTPDHVKGASDAEVAKKRGGRGESGKYAKGGKIPVDVKGGSESGVGRKRQAELQSSWRRG